MRAPTNNKDTQDRTKQLTILAPPRAIFEFILRYITYKLQ